VLHLRLIILSARDDVPSETLLMTDFVNLNIKPAQSFKCAHRGRVCIREFIKVSVHTCISIYIYKNTQKYIQCIILLYLHAPVSGLAVNCCGPEKSEQFRFFTRPEELEAAK
jgi:hypothetical protein